MLNVEEVGEGDPVVMLHGVPATPDSLRTLSERLSGDRRIIAPELYGLGEPSDAVLPELIQTLKAAGGEGAPVLGHSHGAYRAFQLALASDFDVARVLGVGPLAVQREQQLEEFDALAGQIESVDEAVPVAEQIWFSAEYRAEHPPTERIRRWFREVGFEAIQTGLRVELRGPDLRPELEEIEVPVRLVVGEEDEATPPEWAREIHGALPDSELHVIEGAGHFPHLERPERTLPLVEGFLR